VLDATLGLGELGADILDRALVLGRRELRLELRAHRRLALGDELGAHVRPRGRVRRLDGQPGVREVADLDLRV